MDGGGEATPWREGLSFRTVSGSSLVPTVRQWDGLLGPALRAGPSPHARRAAAGGRAPGSRPAPHRSAPRACAPGPGSPSRSRDLRAARRARAPLGPPRRPPARAHELTPRGRGGDFFVRSRSFCESAAGTAWVPLRRDVTAAPRAGGGSRLGPPRRSPARGHTKGTGWRLLVRSRLPYEVGCRDPVGLAVPPRDVRAARRARAPLGPLRRLPARSHVSHSWGAGWRRVVRSRIPSCQHVLRLSREGDRCRASPRLGRPPHVGSATSHL